MSVEVHNRDDGRIEVVEDGVVVWVGRDERTAGTIARQRGGRHPAVQAERRAHADELLPRAIRAMGGR